MEIHLLVPHHLRISRIRYPTDIPPRNESQDRREWLPTRSEMEHVPSLLFAYSFAKQRTVPMESSVGLSTALTNPTYPNSIPCGR